MSLIHLAVGDSTACEVYAKLHRNRTGIALEHGGTYSFAAEGTWYDREIVSGPEGYPPSRAKWYAVLGLWAVQRFKRVPEAAYFELIGEVPVDSKRFIRIGASLPSWTATEDGELGAFANDLNATYGNNSGYVTLVVKRIA